MIYTKNDQMMFRGSYEIANDLIKITKNENNLYDYIFIIQRLS